MPTSSIRLDLETTIEPSLPNGALINGGGFTAPAVAASPDPLVRYVWQETPPDGEPQLFSLRPVAAVISAGQPLATDPQRVCDAESVVSIVGAGNIRVDFGVVAAGWVQFSSPNLGDAVGIELAISAHAGGPTKRLRPVRHGTVYRLELNAELYEGVRFVWLTIAAGVPPWQLRDLRLICQVKPANYRGAFACSDPQLERIWYTGAYTVRVCYQQGYMGTILDDRGDRNNFTGDAHITQAVSLVAFGDPAFVRQNLGTTPGIDDHNGILSYRLFWVLNIAAYVRYSGDLSAVTAWSETLATILQQAHEIFDSDFHQSWSGWDQRMGGGFECPDSAQTRHCYRMLAIRTFREAADMLGRAGVDDLAALCREWAADHIAQVRAPDGWIRQLGLFAALQAVNADFLDEREQVEISAWYGSDPVDYSFISPFHQYFVLRALSRLGRHAEALRLLRDCWGGMLDHGATTFYELYRPELNQVMPDRSLLDCSLTHPWSAGATLWLSEELAGLKPTAPGFASYVAAPCPPAGLTRLSATVPTPRGDLVLRLDTETGILDLGSPQGSLGVLRIPATGRHIRRITTDEGTVIWPSAGRTVRCGAATAVGDDVLFDGVQPGWLSLHIDYAGQAPRPSNPPARRYRAQVGERDEVSGGSWGGAHGALGWQIATGEAASPWRGRLPDFVSRLALRPDSQPQHLICAQTSTDPRALADDPGNSRPPTAAVVQTNPSAHSLWIEVDFKHDHPCIISLYLLDWERNLGHFAVEAYDGDTLNLIAPTQTVLAHEGCYVRFAYHRSCVFRLYRGALAGMFFDPCSGLSQ